MCYVVGSSLVHVNLHITMSQIEDRSASVTDTNTARMHTDQGTLWGLDAWWVMMHRVWSLGQAAGQLHLASWAMHVTRSIVRAARQLDDIELRLQCIDGRLHLFYDRERGHGVGE